jgi:hypothetical protein
MGASSLAKVVHTLNRRLDIKLINPLFIEKIFNLLMILEGVKEGRSPSFFIYSPFPFWRRGTKGDGASTRNSV